MAAERISPIVGSAATPGARPVPVVLIAPLHSTKPLGFDPKPTDGLLLFCCDRKIHQPGVTKITLAPPRTTVLPVPVTSYANPNRGAKLFLSGFHMRSVFF